ncbi:MAG: hypothetical protein WCJ95_21925 [Mariniphaga sp.]
MSKKILLTENYAKIVKKGLLLPVKDLIKYYTTITVKHLPNNPDLFLELKNVINELIEWHLSWAKSDESFIPLSTFGISGSANRAFFENHLKIIEDIERQKKIEMTECILEKIQLFKKNIEQRINERPEPVNNELKTDYSEIQLTNFFDELNQSKKRIDKERKTDFIQLFRNENLCGWDPIKWEGSNPELATLIYKMVGKTPEPAIVNRYFNPKKEYDTHSHSGKRKENHVITTVFNKFLR